MQNSKKNLTKRGLANPSGFIDGGQDQAAEQVFGKHRTKWSGLQGPNPLLMMGLDRS